MIAGAVSGALVVALCWSVRAVVARRRAGRVVRRLGSRPAGMRLPSIRPPRRVAVLVTDAGIEAPPGSVFSAAVAATAAVALVAAVAGGLAAGVLAAVSSTATATGVLVALRGRGDRRYASALPLALDLVARSLRAGASLSQALADAGERTPGAVGADLRAVARAASALGRPLVDAIEEWASRRPLDGVRLAAAALCLGAETGGAQARAVDGVAATVRERLALDGEVRALTSQARTSALVLGVAPLAFCAITVVVDADSAAFLLRSPVGLAMLAAGLGLDGLAALWMHRLTARVAS